MSEDRKHTRNLLIVLGVLALLLAVNQTVLYAFANVHRKEILQNGSVNLFGIFSVTESAMPANPNLIAAAIGVVLAAACFYGANRVKKKFGL
jgi:hypothetical protein